VKLRGLLIACVLLAALGGVTWWSVKKDQKSAGEESGKSAKILTLSEGDIDRVEIQRRDGELTILQKQPAGQWRLVSPAEFATDAEAVSALLMALSGVNSEKVVEEKPGDLAQFGLAQPNERVVIKLKGGKKRTLLIGDFSPVGGGAYAAVDGDAKVHTIASFTTTAIDKRAADLRDKRLLTFDQAKLTRVELSSGKSTVEFSKNPRNEWTITSPKPMRADNWRVEELIRVLREAKLDPTLTEDQRKALGAQFASSNSTAAVAVTDASGTQRIEVRKSKDDKYYAKSSAVDGFHLLTGEAGAALAKVPEEYRNKKLFDFGFSDPAKVEYRGPNRTLVLNKAGEKWVSGGLEMDTVGVQSFIDRLRELTAAKFVETGFSAPVIELTVAAQGGKLNEQVSISKAGDNYIARRGDGATLYEIDSKAIEALERAAADVKAAAPAPPGKK
jgi:hypothetical protein